jgi:LysR family nitrogen assimilation transcriptional regulator
MNFEDLNAFVVVARLKSFSRAALQLRVAQSSLSKRVQRLEGRFGVELLARHGRGVRITEAGAVLLARSEGLVAELQAVERDVSALVSEPSGEVRIALPPLTSYLVSPLIVEQCEKRFPKIRPQLREGTAADTHAWLSRGEIDLGLLYNPEVGSDCEVRPFISEPLFVIGPRVDAGAPPPRPYTIKDLAHLPLMLPRRPHSIRVLIDRLCAGRGIHPNVKYEVDGVNTLKGMIEHGQGVTIFSHFGFKRDIDEGRLSAVPFSTPMMNWKLCIAWPRRDEPFVGMLAVKGIVEQELDALISQGRWPGARRINEL